MKKALLFLILFQITPLAAARMYQWTDPDTGTTQLSGKPPAWYRSGETGPRIFVYENGRLVDDTGILLTETENERLRQHALLQVEQDRQAAMEKMLQAMQRKAALDLQNRDREELEEIPADTITAQRQEVPEDAGDIDSTAPTAEQMRALLEEYERLRTENARQLLENRAPENLAPPPAPQ
jgi:hypothetical protein